MTLQHIPRPTAARSAVDIARELGPVFAQRANAASDEDATSPTISRC